MVATLEHIAIPSEYVEFCANWHNGAGCLLYAVATTGTPSTGTQRPVSCETDEQWHVTLWRELSAELARLCRKVRNYSLPGAKQDYVTMLDFETYVWARVAYLESTYGLIDWEIAE